MKKEIGIILGVLVLLGATTLAEPVFAQEESECNCPCEFGRADPFADLTEEQQENLKVFMDEQRKEMESFMEEQRLEKEKFFSEMGIEIDEEMPFMMEHKFGRRGFMRGFE